MRTDTAGVRGSFTASGARATDFVYLGLPIALLVCVIFEAFRDNKFFEFNGLEARLFLDIVLFGYTHAAISVWIIFFTPEGSEWRARLSAENKVSIVRNSGLVVLGFTVASYYIRASHVLSFTMALYFFMTLLDFHHACAQSYGLSLSLMSDKAKRARAAKIDKYCYLAVALFSSIGAFMYYGVISNQALETSTHWLSRPIAHSAFVASLGLTTLGAVALIVHRAISSKGQTWTLVLYSLRIAIWPFTTFSLFACAATRVVHSIEYLSLAKKIDANASYKSSGQRRAALGGLLLLLGAFAAFSIFRKAHNSVESVQLMAWFDFDKSNLFILSGLSNSMIMLHYYLDRKLYRYRIPASRSIILPLYAGASSEARDQKLRHG